MVVAGGDAPSPSPQKRGVEQQKRSIHSSLWAGEAAVALRTDAQASVAIVVYSIRQLELN